MKESSRIAQLSLQSVLNGLLENSSNFKSDHAYLSFLSSSESDSGKSKSATLLGSRVNKL